MQTDQVIGTTNNETFFSPYAGMSPARKFIVVTLAIIQCLAIVSFPALAVAAITKKMMFAATAFAMITQLAAPIKWPLLSREVRMSFPTLPAAISGLLCGLFLLLILAIIN